MTRLDAIKALRMKLQAKKPGGRFKGKSSIGGTYRSVKPFNESLHPRGPGGKFVASGRGTPERGERAYQLRLKRKYDEQLRDPAVERHGAMGIRRDTGEVVSNKPWLDRQLKKVSNFAGVRKQAGYRLQRAQELRAKRAAKQASAKPSRPSNIDRANRLVKKISDRAHTMEPNVIDRRVDRIGKVLNAKEVAAVEKQQLSANLGKTKAEKLAEIRRQIHNIRKSRDRVQTIMPGGAKPSLKEQAAAHRSNKDVGDRMKLARQLRSGRQVAKEGGERTYSRYAEIASKVPGDKTLLYDPAAQRAAVASDVGRQVDIDSVIYFGRKLRQNDPDTYKHLITHDTSVARILRRNRKGKTS